MFFCSAKELVTMFTVKKSNPAAEPHGFPQGCTVRPRKGAGQSPIGGGGGGY